ncbi:GGDEF domain-containing protein [Marinobacterium zhoushanense]|nr:GGDEF domain-containing protein [Marinobacterium zhoushanense]
MQRDYSHLVHIQSHDELALYELIPDVVWIFDLDKHGWWWGNSAALSFWGLDTLEQLINKDLSGDTQGARDRTLQTFELAAKNGLTVDPWTTYPNGKPKTLYMRHRAVLVGPERHRAIIAYINEEVSLGETPENLLLVEAMRYTTVLVTSFTLDGDIVIENPAATEAYKHIDRQPLPEGRCCFAARFLDPLEGERRLAEALAQKGGRWTHLMNTGLGVRRHTLDIRMTRHPLSGEFLILVAEYDVTDLHTALDEAQRAQSELQHLAHHDALTGIPSLHYLSASARNLLAHAQRNGRKAALLFIDLDRFKEVNDLWGHGAGDQVLVEISKRLSRSVRRSDIVARIGGDEFVILLNDIDDEQDVEIICQKVITAVRQPVPITLEDNPDLQASVSTSIGVALYPDHGRELESLIKAADHSMYGVKKRGKNGYAFADTLGAGSR